MNTFDEQDLHRLVKQLVDSGGASSIEEARAIFQGYSLDVMIDQQAAQRPEHQIALVTMIALARRVFLGGVRVKGALDVPLAVPLPLASRLGDAVLQLGALPEAAELDGRPLVTISESPVTRAADFHARPVYSGWRGGTVASEFAGPAPQRVMPLAPMLAAALVVADAYAYVAGETAAAGRRPVGLSLWHPDARRDWLVDDGAPELEVLPSALWLIGLGHLGQAYLWALGLLPYGDGALALVLQDTDVITRSTESTSILTDASMLGRKKTRTMAVWGERRGFRTAIYERAFDATFRRRDDEPTIALCGVDNGLARRALDAAGFPLVVEAGLGRGHRDFRRMRLHTLPASRAAGKIWSEPAATEDVSKSAAYQQLLADGSLDRCGVTLLAGKAVGAPFVGAVAASLAIGQLLRMLHGGTIDEVIDLDLQSVEHRSVIPQKLDFSALNPGFVRVRHH